VAITDTGDLYVHWIEVRSKDPATAAHLVAGRFEPLVRRVFE
jgi:multisubunit Na+/H+ antiporter MnhE subunit